MRPAQLPVHSQNYSSLRKRSFKSACRRAVVAQQPVSYRGQQLTPVQVRRSGNCPPRHSGRSSGRPPRQRAGLANRDLRVLSWNAGHLGQQQWAEIKSWLQTEARQVCDIFVLQETHWQATAEFSTAGWYCISSASEYVPTEEDKTLGGTAQPAPTVPAGALPNKPRPKRKSLRGSKGPSTTKADGVMVLLSPEIPTNTVRWKEHVKGRLLETRFDWHGARTSVLTVYQHVWSPAKTVQGNKQDRAAILKSLARSVKRVPARDTLVIAGDFNSSVSPTPRLIGPRTLAPQEARPDEAELTNFVRTHHLAVLNTWQVSSPHTFVQGDSRTQIDFLLTKVSSSGGSAKQAAPIANFPLGSWKTGGHLPLLAKIKPVRHWQLPGPRAKPLKHDSEALQQAVRQGLPIVTDMQRWVRDNIHQGMTPPAWDALLSKATQHFFPKQPPFAQADSADTVLARRMWRARRMSVHGCTAEDPDTAALTLQHQKAVRQARKTKADAFLAEVDAAIQAGDQYVAYKVLKQLRPWQPSQKAQLKDSKGYLLSPTGELQELRKYATDVFGKYPRLQDNFVELPLLATTTLAKHIASIKPGKAVPKGAAPAAAWKICAQPVAEALSHYCSSLPPDETLEDGLLSADLCLIPKPGKPADKPTQLRPLGILRPDAKGLAGAAREMLAPYVIPFMKPLPQFAYLPGRGLSDAQSRVVQHLREVRQIGRSAKPSREDRKRGLGPPSLVGGITFALDLSQAFDTVSRQDILDQLQALSVEPSLVSLVHGLHHSSKYRLHAQGGYTEVETTTGIKQGCKLAPTLFSVLTGRLLHMLIDTFGLDAVQQHLTGYADDISVHKTIRSRRDLKLAHDLIQALLEAVGRLRLRVNPAKCSIMVRLSGTEAPSVTRRHTCWLPDASGELKKHWRIGPNKAYPAFRQEGQIKYLGIIISYSNYELLTLRHRLAEASKKIQQVRKYIYNRRIASPAARLRVWFATVWATAVTGLPEVGLSPESARLLRGWYAQKLRSVLNQPAHITHVTTADLLQLHKLQDPVDKIIRRMKGRIAKLRKRSRVVSEAAEDVALHSHILIDLDRILQEAQALPVATSATLEPAYRCHICQAAFDTAHGLRMHTAKMHRDSLSRFIPPIFDRELHAKEGMPVCVACNRSFKQWKGLRDHLLSGACPAPDALRTITSSGTLSSSGFEMLQLQELRREVQSSTRSQLATQAALPSAQILQHRCVVCGFWTPDHTKVKSHIRQAHPQVWQETGEAAGPLCAGHSVQTIKGRPCPFCRRQVYDKKKHPQQCVVLFQVCLCWLRTHPSSTIRGPGPAQPLTAGTRSLKDFFHPQTRPATPTSTPATPAQPVQPQTPLAEGAASAGQTSVAVRTMLNSGNSCYVNSTLQALAALNTGHFAFESLQPLLDLCASHLSDARPLNPTGLFQLRSLLPRWRFDGRQQDASEFYTALTSQGVGDLQAVQWQGRTDGQVEAADVGESPLLLPQSPDHTSLSQIVGAWSESSFQRGLLWAPPLLAVVLGRWSAGHKIHTAVSLSEVSIPVWDEGQTRTWYRYKVRAGVFHIGAEVTSGHYRSFWLSLPHETLLSGDDAVRPTPASASDTKRVKEGSFLLFLVRQ